MNANELPADQLADLLDEIPVGDFESLDHHHFTRQAATMLRNQQAEIEALKSDTIPYKDLHQVVKNVLAQPMHELSDEEIMQVCSQIEPFDDTTIEQAFIEFARAILRKASEKC